MVGPAQVGKSLAEACVAHPVSHALVSFVAVIDEQDRCASNVSKFPDVSCAGPLRGASMIELVVTAHQTQLPLIELIEGFTDLKQFTLRDPYGKQQCTS